MSKRRWTGRGPWRSRCCNRRTVLFPAAGLASASEGTATGQPYVSRPSNNDYVQRVTGYGVAEAPVQVRSCGELGLKNRHGIDGYLYEACELD
jgi:hypothetical protein